MKSSKKTQATQQVVEYPLPKSQVLRNLAEGMYLEKPSLFPRDAMGVFPDDWQAEVLDCFRLGSPVTRVSVAAGHTVGKTFLASLLAHAFMGIYAPSRVIVSGPTGKQTRLQFWAGLNSLWHRSVFMEDMQWQKTKMFVRGKRNEEEWYTAWVSSSKDSKTIEGFHGPLDGKNLLWIIEEAKAVSDNVFESLAGALSNENCFLYISSTCGAPHGHFYMSQTTLKDQYKTLQIPSTMCPRVPERKIREWEKLWGKDSPIFRARVMAEFPDEETNCIANLAWIERAIEKEIDDFDEAA